MLRRWPLPLAICALLAVPASAADHQVVATSGSAFEPEIVTVDLGDSVTWTNPNGGFHNVKFDDGSFEQPSSGSSTWPTVQRAFDTAGVYRYHCEVHGGPDGVGMSGTVRVRDASGEVPEPEPGPGLTLSTKKNQSLERVLKGVRVKVGCKGGCIASVKVLDGDKRVGGASAFLDPGQSERLDIRLKKSARKRLAKREKKFKLRVEAHAINPGGDHTVERKITVKP